MRLSTILVAVLSASAVAAHADVVGTARVIDGDTIVIDGEHIHLQGIEAEAKRRGAGLWRGQFVPPWEWRNERR